MTDAATAPRPGTIEAVRAHQARRDAPRPIAKDVFVVADDDYFWDCVFGAPKKLEPATASDGAEAES